MNPTTQERIDTERWNLWHSTLKPFLKTLLTPKPSRPRSPDSDVFLPVSSSLYFLPFLSFFFFFTCLLFLLSHGNIVLSYFSLLFFSFFLQMSTRIVFLFFLFSSSSLFFFPFSTPAQHKKNRTVTQRLTQYPVDFISTTVTLSLLSVSHTLLDLSGGRQHSAFAPSSAR